MRIKDIPEIELLSTPEKILLVEDFWDHICSDPASVPIPQSHLRELEGRVERQTSQPGTLLSLEELQNRIDYRK